VSYVDKFGGRVPGDPAEEDTNLLDVEDLRALQAYRAMLLSRTIGDIPHISTTGTEERDAQEALRVRTSRAWEQGVSTWAARLAAEIDACVAERALIVQVAKSPAVMRLRERLALTTSLADALGAKLAQAIMSVLPWTGTLSRDELQERVRSCYGGRLPAAQLRYTRVSNMLVTLESGGLVGRELTKRGRAMIVSYGMTANGQAMYRALDALEHS
jgi:hypothetical protein